VSVAAGMCLQNIENKGLEAKILNLLSPLAKSPAAGRAFLF
jgi:hypothetical protein